MSISYILYETTCIPTGKIYVGVHKQTYMNETYLGSGKIIKAAIKKYGRDQFIRKTLFVFDNAFDAYNAEAQIVTEDFLKREDTMNIALGGRGGIISEDVRELMRQKHIGLKHSEETKQLMSKKSKGKNNAFFGKKHTGDLSRFGHEKNCRKVKIDGIIYDSCKAAAIALKLCPSSITKRIKNGKAELI